MTGYRHAFISFDSFTISNFDKTRKLSTRVNLVAESWRFRKETYLSKYLVFLIKTA